MPRYIRLLGVLLLAVVPPLIPRAAGACGPSPPAFWTLTNVAPGPGQTMPIDGGIVIFGKAWTDVFPDRGGDELAQAVEVSVRDTAGVAIKGITEAWWGSAEAALLWRPEVPLPAGAAFRIDATVTANPQRPPGVTGETSFASDFHTTTTTAPPLRLAHEMRLSLETYDVQLAKDCNSCGGGCTPNGSVRSLRARVTIPPVEGGHTPDGYAAWLGLQGGGLVNSRGIERLPRGQAVEVLLGLPAEGVAYAPCFSLQVLDPAGHTVDAEPVCLPSMMIEDTIKQLDGAKSSASGGAGCALSAAPVGTAPAAPAFLALTLALSVGWRLGRRR